jgi:hypothetical protein
MKTYFKTEKSIEIAVNEKRNEGFEIEYGSTCCDCGESTCYKIMNEQFITLEVFILCEACYYNAPFTQRG